MQEPNNKVARFCTTLGTFMVGSSSAIVIILLDVHRMEIDTIGIPVVVGLFIGQIIKNRKKSIKKNEKPLFKEA